MQRSIQEIRWIHTWASKSYKAVTYSTTGSGFGFGFSGGGGGGLFVAAVVPAPASFEAAVYGGGGAGVWPGGGGGAFLTKEDVGAARDGGIKRLLPLPALVTLGERPMEELTVNELPPAARLACTNFAGNEKS
jgi:hypothetical protein